MSATKCLFFLGFEGLPEVFEQGHPHKRPRDVCGIHPKPFSLSCFLGSLSRTQSSLNFGMQLFYLQLEASRLQLSFLLAILSGSLLAYKLSFLLTIRAFLFPIELLAYCLKVCLRSTSTNCKQRSATVSKKAPTVNEKLPPSSSVQTPASYQIGFFRIGPDPVRFDERFHSVKGVFPYTPGSIK